jgi:hypothetical protein
MVCAVAQRFDHEHKDDHNNTHHDQLHLDGTIRGAAG